MNHMPTPANGQHATHEYLWYARSLFVPRSGLEAAPLLVKAPMVEKRVQGRWPEEGQ